MKLGEEPQVECSGNYRLSLVMLDILHAQEDLGGSPHP